MRKINSTFSRIYLILFIALLAHDTENGPFIILSLLYQLVEGQYCSLLSLVNHDKFGLQSMHERKHFKAVLKSLPRSPWTPHAWRVAYSTASTQPGNGCCYACTVSTSHLLPLLTHSDSWQLVTDVQDQTQDKCVCQGCDPPRRKGSVSRSTLRHKYRKGTSHNFLWWHAHACFKLCKD